MRTEFERKFMSKWQREVSLEPLGIQADAEALDGLVKQHYLDELQIDITDQEALSEAFYAGRLLVGVEPAIARRFFTDTAHKEVQEAIGEPLWVERSLTKACLYLVPTLLVLGVVLSILAVNWYAFVVIPAMVIFNYWLFRRASVGKQRVWDALLSVAVCIFLAYWFRHSGVVVAAWVVLLPLPFLFVRLTYRLASAFLRLLAMRNRRVLEMFIGRGVFLRRGKHWLE